MSQPPAEAAQTGPAPQEQKPSGWKPPRTGLLGGFIAIVLAVIGALLILSAWRLPPFATATQGTEDAYVKGRTTVIAPQASGYVSKVLVQDYQHVKQSDVLVHIDDATYRQQLEAAKAQVDVALANLANNDQTVASRRADVGAAQAAVEAANAQLDKGRIDFQRASSLAEQGAARQADEDDARAALRTAEAGLSQANAQVATAEEAVKAAQVQGTVLAAQVESARAMQKQAEIDLSHAQITAPEDGQLSDIGVKVGQYVTNGTQLFFLVPDPRWVVANYKEAQTARMAVGQPAYFTVDALADRRFSGRVDQLSPATGSEFSILRPDNATGNFTKVPQRIPVRILLDPDQSGMERLRPGMSVEAFVDTTGFEEEKP